ncbi:hypothetical protein F503_04090 [Ophiostoma piceae UAMH 11346]|uniref:Uncharacterized protein n=1 Tax=Ophiostoma piceae (strain UAMH 11346) TaxID=1262450 RepID=S3CPL1_OPHP1|nr:hypothetical protein F503_04090 [Ophiostoma piceae UAMH 11346]
MEAETVEERETEDKIEDGADENAALEEDAEIDKDGLQRDARAVEAEAKPKARRWIIFMLLRWLSRCRTWPSRQKKETTPV